jgi:4-diphosphocytidyl-2-C-methyl-D-erythritol kinase
MNESEASYWPAPAKLNLFLHITGQRADGYHLLQTVFQIIDYADEIIITPTNDTQIIADFTLEGVPSEDNLIIRAARLLQQKTHCQFGAKIGLKKNLPSGAGLGGGSSDAATTLVALNYLWDLKLSITQLAKIGLALGADVPVFILGTAAWAEGVGDELTTVTLPEKWFFVVIPEVSISTAEIFRSGELTRDCPPIRIRDFLKGAGKNVCEDVVIRHYPEVAEALDWLTQFGTARMTGTGSCIFVAFDHKHDAEAAQKQLPQKWRGFIAKGLNRSPLYCRLEALTSQ